MTQPSSRTAIGTIVPTGLMLFALFFGAGNLLGAASGRSFIPVMAGFLATGVLMPLITVVAVSTSGEGILGLARRVGPRFGLVMPLAVYLAIGPLYAIARVTTVAYELATRSRAVGPARLPPGVAGARDGVHGHRLRHRPQP